MEIDRVTTCTDLVGQTSRECLEDTKRVKERLRMSVNQGLGSEGRGGGEGAPSPRIVTTELRACVIAPGLMSVA